MKIITLFLIFSCFSLAEEFWIVQNIATLKLRLYSRQCEQCKSKMILEKSIIVGKNEYNEKEDFRTMLGYFEIQKWHKFYVDGKEAYIRWDGRKIPKRGASRYQWGLQGAFGVYAATLTPNIYQHLHGTIGWPNEGSRFIEHEKQKDGSFKRLVSKGCTRVDNQSILYLRNFIPEGTPLIRVYAREKLKNSEHISSSIKKWTYVFYETKDLNNKEPLSYENLSLIKTINVLEIGDFIFDSVPRVVEISKDSVNENPYLVNLEELNYLNIDTGTLEKNYNHPKKLPVGGKIIPKIYFEK